MSDDFRASLAHLEAMATLTEGERVASAVTVGGTALAYGVTVKRCRVKRDGWIVRWDNGATGRVATINIRRLTEGDKCNDV